MKECPNLLRKVLWVLSQEARLRIGMALLKRDLCCFNSQVGGSVVVMFALRKLHALCRVH